MVIAAGTEDDAEDGGIHPTWGVGIKVLSKILNVDN